MDAPKHPKTAKFVGSGLFANLKSFKELEGRISALGDNVQMGDAFEVFAEAFLVTQEGIDPDNLWPQGTEPLSLRNELGLPRDDFGIDGIYLNQSGQYDPYQCKFRNGRPTLGWQDLATFVALASNDKFANKVLFTNCEYVAPILRGRVVLIRGSRLDQLSRNDLEVIADWISQRPPAPTKHEPRRDQKEAVSKINQVLQSDDRTQCIVACGGGKSLTSLWLKESRAPKTTLVLVPSLALLAQIRHDWLQHRATAFRDLCVCSDPSVKDGDEPSFSSADCDFPVRTAPEEVRRFLDEKPQAEKVVFCTYQSAPVLMAAGPHVWDLGILDEAHKTAGRDGGLYSTALSDKNIRIQKRVFFTATPRHCSIRKDRESEEEVVYSMDDETQYGKVAYELSFRKAVELGIICEYKVLVTEFTTNEVNDWLRKHGETLVTPTNDTRHPDWVKACQVANQLAVAKLYQEYGIKKTFSFHNSVDSARSFVSDKAEGLRSHLPDVLCRTINGYMTVGERQEVMDEFKEKPKALLSNAKCLTEGVNVPAVDCVAFLSPKESRIDIAQAIGRAMRKNEGKKQLGYVLVPLYMATAEGECLEEAARRAKFETVLEVLQTLKEIDEKFADEIRELAEPKKRANGFADWRGREHVEFIAPNVLLQSLIETIAIQQLDRLIPSWDKRIAELIAYKEAHGNCDVPREDASREICSLGVWCATVRGKRRIGALSPDRIAQLTVMGFCWEPHAALWEKRYAELVAYKEIHGHCNVLQNSGPLGSWCSNQRAGRKGGELSPEQITKLDALGFWWNTIDAQWDKMFAELVAYKEAHGHCNVPQANGSLGAWCTTQRVRRKQGKLSPERIAQLDTLGLCWDDHIVVWDKKIAELVAYKQANGNCDAPTETTPLGRWCDQQRQRRRKGKLSPERIAQLDALGFCWHVMDAAWGKRYSELVNYKEIHGHCNTQRVGPTKDLDRWCWKQRARYKRGTLSLEEIAQLNALGFCWDFTKTVWDERFSELVAYKEIHGHCNVSRSHAVLERWCTTQRQRRKSGNTITQEQIAQLDAIGFDWSPIDTIRTLWDQHYAELVAFKEANGHCNVIQSSGFLGKWCTTQRRYRNTGELILERIARLDAIGFDWDPVTSEWDKNYAELVAYKEAHGHLPIGKRSALGSWCGVQRVCYKNGKLSSERIAKLEAIGFPWDVHEERWEKNYADLVTFKKVHGHCIVPTESALSSWCSAQRTRKETLSSERIAQLDTLGFTWDAREALWGKNYAELVAYKEAKGHCNVPANSGPLGAWCSTQRIECGKGKMTSERIDRLDAIGFDWNPIITTWDKNYAELVAYKEEHGHCNINKENSSLGRWCSFQRKRHKKGNISPEQIAQLEKLGFRWNTNDVLSALWDKHYAQLVAFKKVNGHCEVPFENGTSPLGAWCATQRRFAKKAKLSQERIARLDVLGFCWDQNVAEWDKNFTSLVAFQKTHGHCNVTRDVGVLGTWCTNVRHRRKKGTLTSEQIAQLEAIGFCWSLRDALWEKNYAELVAYKEVNGHCDVPFENGTNRLGGWCHGQRQRRNNLTPDRIAQLDALGFCWQFRIPNRTKIEHGISPTRFSEPGRGVLNARTESR